jgi:hypothetical protein
MRRINVILGGLVLAAVGLLLTLGVLALLDDGQAEAAAVRKHLAAIPKVRVTYVSDPTKQASQCITAYVDVDGKGALGFNGLRTSSFGHSSRIRLHGIGPYGFRTRELVKGQEGYGYDIDIGASSPIPAARKLGITSVQSAIARYDELLAIVAHWPVTTNDWPRHWPARTGGWSATSDEEVHFPDLPRGDYYFCLKRHGDRDEQMWPPNYPKGSE